MKLEPYLRDRHIRNRSTGRLLFTLALSAGILAGIMALTSCGGTFTLAPDGTLSYTTPEIINPSGK